MAWRESAAIKMEQCRSRKTDRDEPMAGLRRDRPNYAKNIYLSFFSVCSFLRSWRGQAMLCHDRLCPRLLTRLLWCPPHATGGGRRRGRKRPSSLSSSSFLLITSWEDEEREETIRKEEEEAGGGSMASQPWRRRRRRSTVEEEAGWKNQPLNCIHS